jgi:hypothetical protein
MRVPRMDVLVRQCLKHVPLDVRMVVKRRLSETIPGRKLFGGLMACLGWFALAGVMWCIYCFQHSTINSVICIPSSL